jgi:hypothetical protein
LEPDEEAAYNRGQPTARAKAHDVNDVKVLHAEGLSMGEIAKRLGIGKGSVHRALNPA